MKKRNVTYTVLLKTVILVSSFRFYQPFCIMFKHEWCIVRVTKNRRIRAACDVNMIFLILKNLYSVIVEHNIKHQQQQ